MTDIEIIAAREGRTVGDIQVLLQRWCAPIVWALPTAIKKAAADDPSWRQWVDYDHSWLAEAGYYDSATTAERRQEIAQQFCEGRS